MTSSTKQQYDLIPVVADNLFKYTGNYFQAFENGVFNLMRKMCPDYQGGAYEYRVYKNGAFAMVLPDDGKKHQVNPLNGYHVQEVSFEAISLACNLIMYSQLCFVTFEKNDTKHNSMFHDQFHGLRDALCGVMRFMIDLDHPEGHRVVSEQEAMDYEQVSEKERSHPEIEAIIDIID